MKILVIGSGGRLGAAVSRHLEKSHEVTGYRRQDLDLQDSTALLKTLTNQKFDVLINCAAVTSVDYCEDHEEEAMAVNALAPAMMAAACAEKRARLFHVSTDYVFDGKSPNPRREEETPNPLGIYGLSKKKGEDAVLGVEEARPLVIRVSWVFGPDRPSFLDSMIHRALENEQVEAISDKWSSPGYTEDYAHWFEALLHCPDAEGLLHLCNKGAASWQEYAQAGLDAAAKAGLPLKTSTVEGIALASVPFFKAPRPVHTVMDTEKFTALTGITPRYWQEAVDDYVTNCMAPAYDAQS